MPHPSKSSSTAAAGSSSGRVGRSQRQPVIEIPAFFPSPSPSQTSSAESDSEADTTEPVQPGGAPRRLAPRVEEFQNIVGEINQAGTMAFLACLPDRIPYTDSIVQAVFSTAADTVIDTDGLPLRGTSRQSNPEALKALMDRFRLLRAEFNQAERELKGGKGKERQQEEDEEEEDEEKGEEEEEEEEEA